MNLELPPEEQKLRDTMDKITNEMYSQLGIPRLEAKSAVKATIIAYDTFIQKNLKEK